MQLAADKRSHERLVTAGVCLAAVALLPLAAVLAFAMRPVLLAVIVLVVAGWAIGALFVPAMRRVSATAVAPPVERRGLELPPDVMLDPGHEWLRRENGEVVVGVDDLAQSALGPLDGVELPADGLVVRTGDPLFRLRRGRRAIDFLSPLAGTVVSRNETVRESPWLVNRDPYGRGWLVRVRGDVGAAGRPSLLRGAAARAWLDEEADRLGALVRSESPASAWATAGDLPVERLYREIDDTAWSRLTQTFISVPGARTSRRRDGADG